MPEIRKIANPYYTTTTVATTAVQNTWITILETSNIEIIRAMNLMGTADETIEEKITINGVAYSSTGVNHTQGSIYYCYLLYGTLYSATGVNALGNGNIPIKANTFKYEIRKTTAAGANTLTGKVEYHKY